MTHPDTSEASTAQLSAESERSDKPRRSTMPEEPKTLDELFADFFGSGTQPPDALEVKG